MKDKKLTMASCTYIQDRSFDICFDAKKVTSIVDIETDSTLDYSHFYL